MSRLTAEERKGLGKEIREAIKHERGRIIKWGNEECSHPWQPKFRRECPECWQALTQADREE